jgi:hypothetical protein
MAFDLRLPDWAHCEPSLSYKRVVGTKSNLSYEKSDTSTESAAAERTTAKSAAAEPATADDLDIKNQETMDLFLEISATMQTQNELSEGNTELECDTSALNTIQDTLMPAIHDPELASGNGIGLDKNSWLFEDIEGIEGRKCQEWSPRQQAMRNYCKEAST